MIRQLAEGQEYFLKVRRSVLGPALQPVQFQTSYKDAGTYPNPCNYIWNSRGKFGVKKSSLTNATEFADPFKLKDFLLKKELKNPDSRVSEVRSAIKLAEKEVVVM